ncbi:hypothetical protein M0R45_031248 [Rubus argutus]|uniref:LysM domain-containing protein n=1 Tax=Rubus argutus TaxID=59490 RepID=A0AAW1WHJ4_RUBAR
MSSDPSSMPGDGDGDAKDNYVAKTAGLVVFSGIAISILKALNPFIKNTTTQQNLHPLSESTQPSSQPQQPIVVKEPQPTLPKTITSMDQSVPDTPELLHRTINIEKGDTLWGLSRRYGVSIDEIKEANGITGDTIYAGKKLIIP